MDDALKEQLDQEFEKQKKELQKPNLMVVGGTGVGKSSLLNKIFGKEVAKVGAGEPVTQGLNKIETENIPIVFWDTEGYESRGESNSNFEQNVIPKISEMKKSADIKDHVHLCWYCISISNHRITPYDIKNIKFFKDKNIKTAVVFTQCDNDSLLESGEGKTASEFKSIIKSDLGDIPCFETSTEDDLPLDLEKLLTWSQEELPNDQLKQSFVGAQSASVALKKKVARKIVLGFSASCATTAAANPLPLSDSLLIAPQQMAMCVSINRLFFGSIAEGVLKSLVSTQLMSLAGRQLVASLAKFIPGWGQAINGAVAGALTFALGTALTEVSAMAYEDFVKTGKMPVWAEIFDSPAFTEFFKSAHKSYGKDNK